ncbi:protein HESO1-like [Vicia villosa]|uniref:protein HESO1-like n=1 Tax=Vicia villosa TaxID=3911 RepID=UPI00273B0815|nr:protein HESO1-like [Vicia villosa]
MELSERDQLKAAERLESEKLAKINFNPTRIVDLDALLCDTYDKQCPKPVHYDNRRDLIRIFNMIAQEIYGNSKSSPVVEEYGSFVMDIFNEKSDLDLSINFSKDSIEISRQKKIDTLRKFSKKLRSIQRNGHVTALEVILSAKVPIIKVTDSGTGIECDLSVGNWDGIAKSHIIRAISAIDERFQKLSLLMKSWAKAHNINSSRDATLNSLSIISFVAFHLQTCDPPILPPFSTLLKDGADLESVTKIVKTHTNYGNKNKESLAKLFVTLLVKLASVENLWQDGFCTSSYKGSWVLKSWRYSMSIEDFTDPSQNVARAVRAEGFKAIYKCIHNSIDYVSRFLNGEIQGFELMDHLFGNPMVSSPGVEGTSTSTINEKKNTPPILRNPRPTKKKKRSLAKNLVPDFQRTNPRGTDQVHVLCSTLGVQGTTTTNINGNKNNPSTSGMNENRNTPPTSNINENKNNPPTSSINENKNNPPTSSINVNKNNPPTSIIGNKNKPPTLQNPRPAKKQKQHLGKNQVRDFYRTESWSTGPVHAPPSINMPNGIPSFTPPLPYQSQYQSPFATYSSNFEHHSYVPRNVPPPPPFSLNPAVTQFSYNPSVQSHHVLSQTDGGYVPTFHQNAVASNSYHGSFPQSSLQGRDYASLHRRDYAPPQRWDYGSPQRWDYAYRRDYGSPQRWDYAYRRD